MIFSRFVIETLGTRMLDFSMCWVLYKALISLLTPSRLVLEALSNLVVLQLPCPGQRSFRNSGDPNLGGRYKSNSSPKEPDHLVCSVTAGVVLCLLSNEEMVCHQLQNKHSFCIYFQ